MDQIRQALRWLQRHHFWVLIVLTTVIAVGVWFQGASALYDEFQRNKQTIESEFSSQTNLRNQPFHANEQINSEQEKEIEEQREIVHAHWQRLYQRQRDDVLKWPGNLSEKFHRVVEKLQFGESIPHDLRDHYNNYIGEHFPELPKIVQALEVEDSGRRGAGRRGGALPRGRTGMPRGMAGRRGGDDELPSQQDYLVLWHDQQRIRDELYRQRTPSSKRIWVIQEDLWVYEALLGIIARTNEAAGADRYSNAAVREIVSMEVGQPAAEASRQAGRIEIRTPADDAGQGMNGFGPMASGRGRGALMDGAAGAPMGGPMGDPMGGRGRGLGQGQEDGDAQLFVGRYLDDQGMPIAATGAGVGEFGKEFKRLPVRLQLVMDQRWLSHLIAECANAPLQVEVTEVRINPPGGLESGGRGSSGRRTSRNQYSRDNEQTMTPDPEPNISPVVVQGTIFIFNPPTEDDSAEQLADVQ